MSTTATQAKAAPSLKAMAESKIDGVQKTTQFQVDPRIIEIEQGFNARPIDPEHVAAIKVAKKNGAVFPPIFVRVESGRIIIVDGHHRLTADLELIAEGVDIKRVDCMQFRGNDAERIALMLTTAQGKPLTPLQAAIQYKKLTALGWKATEIADKIGRTRQHVESMIELTTLPSEILAMVNDDKVAASTALEVVKVHGENAITVLKQAHAEISSSGTGLKRVTPKAVIPRKQSPGFTPNEFQLARQEVRDKCAELCESMAGKSGLECAEAIRMHIK